jgi:hypothetical protein
MRVRGIRAELLAAIIAHSDVQFHIFPLFDVKIQSCRRFATLAACSLLSSEWGHHFSWTPVPKTQPAQHIAGSGRKGLEISCSLMLLLLLGRVHRRLARVHD